MKKFLLLSLLFATFLTRAQAQVPNLINYQGRISVGTTNFTGTGQFRFALTNSDGSTFYWTNDGTGSPSGQQPVNYVAVTVTKGLYSVLLGDTTLPNMTAIPTSVWSNPDVRLRVYFSDGTNSSQALSPDQRLAPTGYLASGLTLAGTPSVSGDLNLPATTSAATGVLDLGGSPFLHAYGANGLSSGNTFAGSSAGNFTLSGTFNTGAGYQTLAADTSGSFNTASGATALKLNTTGNGNTAAGYQALLGNTAGSNNSALGNAALSGNTTAGENVAFGTGALQLQSFANSGTAWNSLNVAVGYQTLYSNQPTATTNGINNVAVGGNALYGNTTGANNIGLGNNAGLKLTTGSNNIDIGSQGVAADANIIRLGDGSTQSDTYLTGNVHLSGTSTIIGSGSGLTGITSSGLAAGSVTSTQIASGAVGFGNLNSAISSALWTINGSDIYRNGGSVGIGTTTPLYTLDVTGTVNVNGPLGLTGSTGRLGVGQLYGNVGLTVRGISGDLYVFDLLSATGTIFNVDYAGNTNIGGTLSVSGATTLGTLNAGSTSVTGTLSVSGTTTLGPLAGDLSLPTTSSASVGVLNIGSSSFLHAYGGGSGNGAQNTFLGSSTGNFTQTGVQNTGLGGGALQSLTSGSYNTATGVNALSQDAGGSMNTANGMQALTLDTTGSNNTASGFQSLKNTTIGNDNTAFGYSALSANATANQNVAVGSGALNAQSYNNGNTAWSSNNVAVGYKSLYNNQPTATTNGYENTALGFSALLSNTTGSNNTALGYNAGSSLTTGSNDIDIGSKGVAGESNIIRIGDGSTQTDTYLTGVVHATRTLLAPGFNATIDPSNLLMLTNTANDGTLSLPDVVGIGFGQVATRQAIVGGTYGNDFIDFYTSGALTAPKVRITGNGSVGIGVSSPSYLLQLVTDSAGKPNGGSWATSSDRRIKQNIEPMRDALTRLTQLRGVTFEWRNPEDHANQQGRQAGFIAQEVESAFPKWVTEIEGAEHDRALTENGKIKSMSLPFEFDALVVESIKTQQAEIVAKTNEIEALKGENTAMKQRLADLEAALKKQVAASEAKDKERDTKLAAIEELLRINAQPTARPASFQ